MFRDFFRGVLGEPLQRKNELDRKGGKDIDNAKARVDAAFSTRVTGSRETWGTQLAHEATPHAPESIPSSPEHSAHSTDQAPLSPFDAEPLPVSDLGAWSGPNNPNILQEPPDHDGEMAAK